MLLRHKTPLLILLMVLLPVTLLTLYSFELQDNRKQLLRHQQDQLAEQKLVSYNQSLQGHFQRLQQRFIALASFTTPGDIKQLRQLRNSSPYLLHIFQLNEGLERIFPTREQALSQAESEFLRQYRPLFEQPALLTNISLDTESSKAASTSPKSRSFSAPLADAPALAEQQLLSKSSPVTASGWLSWYNDNQLVPVFWWRSADDITTGFVLNPSRLKADLISLLPLTGEQGVFQLLDSAQSPLHQWGEPNGKQQQLSRILDHPLTGWQLTYSGSYQSAPGESTELIIAPAIVTLLLTLIGLYIYYEQRRTSREALQKVNFVNQVSHELKTPLTNIRLYAELLSKRLQSAESKEQRYIGVITNESLRLSRLIDNVLSFARLNRDDLRVNRQPQSPDDTIERSIANFSPAFEQLNIQCRFDGDASSTVMFDADLTEQILNNLLSNCEKYAGNGATIEISSALSDHLLQIDLKDDGPGIDPTTADAIFKPFYRCDNSITEGVAGTGIGLALAQELAEAHGGNLTLAASEKGAHFKLTLEVSRESSDR